RTVRTEARIEQILSLDVEKKKPLRIEKTISVHTSRDWAISEPLAATRNALHRAGRWEDLRDSHRLAWEHIWDRADIRIDGTDEEAQLLLRFNVFHLIQTTSMNVIDLDVGVPARGLHGEAYRGHIFWDELFIFPLLNFRFPEVTRSLLMYRYRRLNEARHLAIEAGHEGAMFPWQSGSDGREESQVLHLNPKSGRWIPDDTHRQRHINAAIAYNVWQYFQVTDDREFLSFYGAEMLLEVARFWASISTYDADRERYEIHHVVGPDEFHTRYPGAESSGLSNNAYTNVMACWTLGTACRAFEMLSEDCRVEISERLGITDDEFERWDHISRKMFIPFHGDGIISQFEGYADLEELDWEGYREKYGDIQRLDRILEAEGDSPNRYKAGKQADVLMLFYLFSAEELGDLFERLGYRFDRDLIPRNIDYYTRRSSDGSTLSRVVHSWVLARSERERAWELFLSALGSDLSDIQGGTTAEGIHLGALAGSVDLMQRGHTGIDVRDDVLWLNPCLPEQLEELRLGIRYRGHWLSLVIHRNRFSITAEKGWAKPVQIGVHDTIHSLKQGQSRSFSIRC
ncbi:MAG: glycoside hydrolase family 65 protein, partial [Candidatus Eisenbacteria bacterium]|nr:glycoside hydrolase family 65 protein [Candidatus Latescibacterota bacterium]MBD3302463.1 glycoside hydrolase family 65 protein [Candidatus Eisenbacteria bacterium]